MRYQEYIRRVELSEGLLYIFPSMSFQIMERHARRIGRGTTRRTDLFVCLIFYLLLNIGTTFLISRGIASPGRSRFARPHSPNLAPCDYQIINLILERQDTDLSHWDSDHRIGKDALGRRHHGLDPGVSGVN
jgi:hypothetical protein